MGRYRNLCARSTNTALILHPCVLSHALKKGHPMFKIENGKTEGKKREECGSLVAKNDAPLQYTLDSTLLGMYSLLY